MNNITYKYLRKIGALFTSFVISAFSINSAFAAQELWSQQNVTFDPNLSSGSAVYSYPIDIPPGRNGVMPELSLEYSSNEKSASSEVGYGWRLPINRIVRNSEKGVRSMYTDNIFSLEINGGLIDLVQISSTGGEKGVYGAKIEGSFLKIEFLENDSWVVTNKEGLRYIFGSSTSSRIDNPNDLSQIYAWNIDEMRDLNDNYVSYSYYKDGSRLYLSIINYTNHGIEVGDFTVKFQPFANGLLTERSDKTSSAESGFLVDTRYLIDSIEIYKNGNLIPDLQYDFNYIKGSNGSRSLLNKVTKKGLSDTKEIISLPPTEFTYSQSTNSWTKDDDYLLPNWGTTSLNLGFGDFSGDGIVDEMLMRYLVDEGYDKQIQTGTPNGMIDESNVWDLPDFVFADPYSLILDLNNDGLTDFVRSYYNQATLVYNKQVFINTGNNSFEDKTDVWSVPDVDFSYDSVKVGDFNGDGFLDILKQDGCSGDICLTTQVWENDGVFGWHEVIDEYSISNVKGTAYTVIDLNGDGLADFWMHARFSGNPIFAKKILINNGNGTWTDKTPEWNIPDDDRAAIVDINGDGLVDIYRINGNGIDFSAYINNGRGFDLDSSITSSAGGSAGGRRFYDIDGNGLVDSIYLGCNGYTYECTKDVWKHDGVVPDILQSIKLPTGGIIEYSYESSATQKDSSGNLVNTKMPFVMQVVSEITRNDGLGHIWTTKYLYKNGLFVHTNQYDGRFAGFAEVEEIFDDGSKQISYFHQGNPEDGISKGEYQDHYDKIGRKYKTEIYNIDGILLQRVMTGFNREDLGNGRSFVHPFRELIINYNLDGTYISSGKMFSFDQYGNIQYLTDFGDVETTSDSWGSFTDVGSDLITTRHWFIQQNEPYLVGLIHSQKSWDMNNIVLKYDVYFYDNLPWGQAIKGNQTYHNEYVTGSTWITSRIQYNNYGNITYKVDPNGNRESYWYSSDNMYPSTILDAYNNKTNIIYDRITGKEIYKKDPNGVISESIIDTFGRVSAEKKSSNYNKDILDIVKEYSFDLGTVPNKVITTEHPNPTVNTISYQYLDGFGRLIQTRKTLTTNNSAVSDIQYNDIGKIVYLSNTYESTGLDFTIPDLLQPNTITSYDRIGRVIKTSDNLGSVVNTYTDYSKKVTDENGNDKIYTYNVRGNLIRVDEFNSGQKYSTTYNYDAVGNLKKMTDSAGNIRDFEYDMLGRKTMMTDLRLPTETDIRSWHYTYDKSSNLIKITDPENNIINYTYDKLNRVLTEDNENTAGIEISNSYDSAINGVQKIAHVKSGDITTDFEYGERGDLVKDIRTISNTSYITLHEYDNFGREVRIVYPNGSELKTAYNNQNLVESKILDNEVVISSVNYNENDQPEVINYGNGVVTANTYDANSRNRLQTRVTSKGAQNLQDLTYTYDNVGNILEIVNASNNVLAQTTDYVYDDLYRLLSVTSDSYSRNYGYDSLGNMISNSEYGTLTYGTVQNSNPHALSQIGTNTYTYDRNGNVINDGARSLNWNYRNELVETDDGTRKYSYIYNESGDRIVKTDKNTNQSTIYIDNYVVDEETNTQEIHISFGSDPVFTKQFTTTGTKSTWQHADHLNGVQVTTDGNGVWQTLEDFYPFGETRISEVVSGAEEGRFDFTNKERDESGLNYFEARYLDTRIGKFNSLDPVFLNPDATWLADPQAQNAYAYARNNPLRYNDPDGRWLDTIVDVGFIITDLWAIGSKCLSNSCHGAGLDAASLGADALATIIPGFTGGGAVLRATKMGDNLIDGVKAVDNIGDTVKYSDEVADAMNSSKVYPHTSPNTGNPNTTQLQWKEGQVFQGKTYGDDGGWIVRNDFDGRYLNTGKSSHAHYPNDPKTHVELPELQTKDIIK